MIRFLHTRNIRSSGCMIVLLFTTRCMLYGCLPQQQVVLMLCMHHCEWPTW